MRECCSSATFSSYEGDELNIHTSSVYLMALLGMMRHRDILYSQWLNLNLPHTTLAFLVHFFSFLCINNAFFFFRRCFLLHFLPAELLFPRTDLTGGALDVSLPQLSAQALTHVAASWPSHGLIRWSGGLPVEAVLLPAGSCRGDNEVPPHWFTSKVHAGAVIHLTTPMSSSRL